MSSPLDLRSLAADGTKQIIVCCGSGGVGKTTLAASIALAAAESGRRVVVVTIDPARRLAQALGAEELGNEPHRVADVDGQLDAVMLDMKRTLDDMVLAYAPDERAAEILANPFYRSISSSLVGTHEYMAMEKLGQLADTGSWDLIVVDTPPSRSALDFLDAPKRLERFWDSRVARLLLAPTRRGMVRAVTLPLSLVNRVISRVIGTRLLTDASAFAAAVGDLFGGFHDRASHTLRRMTDDSCAFVVVATPTVAAITEANFFAARLKAEHISLAGFVVNRTLAAEPHASTLDSGTSRRLAGELAAAKPLLAGALAVHAAQEEKAAYQRSLVATLAENHPAVACALLGEYDQELTDLTALRGLLA